MANHSNSDASRDKAQGIRRVEKPWGYELIWAHTERYVGKILHVKKGERLSLQYHQKKEETIFIASGEIQFFYEDVPGELREKTLRQGESHHILPGRQHRMVAIADTDIFEVSTPELDDVVRLEDAYGRAPQTKKSDPDFQT